jgi:hypothetical protein
MSSREPQKSSQTEVCATDCGATAAQARVSVLLREGVVEVVGMLAVGDDDGEGAGEAF